MTNQDIINGLKILRPAAQWTLYGDDLSTLTWHDLTQTRPTDEEIINAIASYVPPPTLEDKLAALQAQMVDILAARNATE